MSIYLCIHIHIHIHLYTYVSISMNINSLLAGAGRGAVRGLAPGERAAEARALALHSSLAQQQCHEPTLVGY